MTHTFSPISTFPTIFLTYSPGLHVKNQNLNVHRKTFELKVHEMIDHTLGQNTFKYQQVLRMSACSQLMVLPNLNVSIKSIPGITHDHHGARVWSSTRVYELEISCFGMTFFPTYACAYLKTTLDAKITAWDWLTINAHCFA